MTAIAQQSSAAARPQASLRRSFALAALNKRFLFSLIVFLLIVIFGFLGPIILGRDTPLVTVGGLYDKPSADAWLGTANFGRDVFTQLMYLSLIHISEPTR